MTATAAATTRAVLVRGLVIALLLLFAAGPSPAAADVTEGQWPGAGGPIAANSQFGYPYPNPPMCTNGGACIPDRWNAYQGQCTSWVAYRLNQLNGIAFNNAYRQPPGQVWGNATDWAAAADRAGIVHNGTPAVGSVAWFTGRPGANDGHVSYVEKVISPTQVVVSEMNYDFKNGFRVKTITTASGWPTGFIHIADTGGIVPPSGVSAVSYSGAVAGDYGGVVVLSAGLVDGSTRAGLGGRSVVFSLGSQGCSAQTDGSGNASCSVTLSQAPGGYTVKAAFAGDGGYSAGSDSKPFTIRRRATRTTYTGPVSADYFDPFTASATLTDAGGAPVAGETVGLSLGGVDGCSGVSDASGGVACVITPTQPVGAYGVVASFGGDSLSLASSDSKSFVVTREETVTTLAAVPAQSQTFGQPVTFTAVSAADLPAGAPAPTGSTAFTVDGTPVGSRALAGGSASTSTASLRAGRHAVAATYGGDQNFLPSSGGLPYLVTCDVNVSGVHNGALIVTTTTCLADGTHVNGAVIVEPGGALDVERSTVTGAIGASQGAGVIRVCASKIAGAVDVKNSGALVIIGDPGDASCAPNEIGGALDVKDNTHGVEAVNNQVGGATLTSGNSGPGPYPAARGAAGAPQTKPAARPTQTQTQPQTPTRTLAAAIKACAKQTKAKKQSCRAPAQKRHPRPTHKTKTKAHPGRGGR